MSLSNTVQIAVFEGDGIGPEITGPTIEILKAVGRQYDVEFRFEHLPAGAGHYLETGEDLPEESISRARAADAILLSAMGLPDVRKPNGTEATPQIDLRLRLGLYAGVRPVKVYAHELSPLSDPRAADIDFVIVRESTEGLFAHMHEGRVVDDSHALETLRITRPISEKLFDFSFNLARKRAQRRAQTPRVTCVDKANVFRAFWFFRSIFEERSKLVPEITTDSAYIDAMALWMVTRPWEFDVLVTENMFGDILSDLGAGLMGSLGMAPSADIGDEHAVFQPCHGSAPDIAGKGIANPCAMILSAGMMLDWLAERRNAPALAQAALQIEQAVGEAIRTGSALTADVGGTASTAQCAQTILRMIEQSPPQDSVDRAAS